MASNDSPEINIAQPLAPADFSLVPGAHDVDHGSISPVERPSWSETASAAFQEGNTVSSYLVSDQRKAPSYVDPDFNPWDSIKGTKYEPHWQQFVNVRNAATDAAIKSDIDRKADNERTLAASPWYQSLPMQLLAGTLDVPTLLPGGAFVRGAKGGIAVMESAGVVARAAASSAAVQELGLHASQPSRTAGESAQNIGASVFLGGLLGAAGAKLLSGSEWSAVTKKLEQELAAPFVPTESMSGPVAAAGAEAVAKPELEGLSIAGSAASGLAAATKNLNPALRLLQSPSAETRDIATKLFENSVYMKQNMEGVASAPAVETLMKEWNGGLVDSVRTLKNSFDDYAKSGGALKWQEFREEVGKAMRRGDVSDIPQVAEAARTYRSRVFDPLKEAAIKNKLLPEDVSVDTAASYFSRMWNRNKLVAQEGRFKDIVRQYIEERAPMELEEFNKRADRQLSDLERKIDSVGADAAARSELEAKYTELRGKLDEEKRTRFFDGDLKEYGRRVADEVHATLTGRTGEGMRPEFITVKSRGPMKERTFNIPDALVEDFLEHDVQHVAARYTRVMGADVELAGKFGSPDMAEQVQKIRDHYSELRAQATDEKSLIQLGKAEKNDIRDVTAIRDLLRGTYHPHAWEENFATIARNANHLNYIRSMGEPVLASLTDTVRIGMVHGLSGYMTGLKQLATNLDAVRLSVKEAQLAGNVAERVLAHRLATMAEIVDPYASRGPIEKFLENASNVASKWNGIRIWTDGMKSFASVMTQNRILKGVENLGQIKQSERAYLAFLGIDQSMGERILKQFREHGQTLDGVRVAGTENWTDEVARRTYRAAVNKDVDSVIVQKSVADVPLFANTALGRSVLQFKSFTLASHQKVLMRGLQEDKARMLGGIVAMTSMGMFQVWLKGLTGNRLDRNPEFVANPGWWIGEGVDKSGVVGPLMEASNVFEKMTGVNPVKSPVQAFDQQNAESQKIQNRSIIGALVGPSAGLIDDVTTVAGIPRTLAAGDDLNQGQKGARERLIPFNSYFGMRQFLRYIWAD